MTARGTLSPMFSRPLAKPSRIARPFALAGLAGALGLVSACSIWSGPPEVTSISSGLTLSTSLPTRVYSFEDQNTADFYMTDLPPETWTNGGDVSHATGVFVHIHMFLASRAGRTPINSGSTVFNTRVIVLAGGAMGVYGGGGFLLRDGEAGDDAFGGRISQATLRLLRATPGFVDRLGPCQLNANIDATLDQEQAANMKRAFDTLIKATAPVAEPTKPEDNAAK